MSYWTAKRLHCLTSASGLINLNNICPSTASTPSSSVSCLSQLPSACNTLKNSNGLDLAPLLNTCKAALGGYGTGAVQQCLDSSKIVYGSKGLDVVSCLTGALPNICLTTLPASCTSLTGLSGTTLSTKLPQCITDLGPFANDSAKNCAASNPASGQEFLNCITISISGGTRAGRVSGGSTDIGSVPGAINRVEPASGGSSGSPDYDQGQDSGSSYNHGSDKGHKKKGHKKGKGHKKDSESESLSHFSAGGTTSSSDFWWKFNEWVWKHYHGQARNGGAKAGQNSEDQYSKDANRT
ncbi:hypothetical protein E4U55_005611 [Claviceps digitariae]|nr:hypothetical protein E4U55_005611 [Claviceps digitariae]